MWLQNMHKAECCYICSPLKSIIRESHLSIFTFLPVCFPYHSLNCIFYFHFYTSAGYIKKHGMLSYFRSEVFSRFVWITFYFASKAATELLLYSTPNLTPIYKIDIDDFLICIYWSLVLMRFKYLKKKGDEVCLNYVLVWLVGYNEVNNIWREFVLMQSATEHLIISWRHH